jgi:molybdopterin molybdotransferase
LIRVHGGVPIHLGISRDDPEEMIERLGRIGADMYITTGGTGQGEKDFVAEVWKKIGVEVLFQGLNVFPGKGAAAGVRQARIYLALPGSPWGGRVIFEELIKPYLWHFQEVSCRWPLTFKALLKARVTNREAVCRVVPGELDLSRWPPSFEPAAQQRGSLFEEIRNRFGYIILEPHMLEVSASSEVDVRLFDLPLLAVALLGNGEEGWNGSLPQTPCGCS